MKTIITFTQAFVIMMSITFAAKAETAKEILRNKIKTEALSYFNDKQYDKALELYLQVADEAVEKGQIDYMIGMCYMSSAEQNKALSYLIAAEKSNENTFVVNYYLGNAYYNAGDYTNAIAYLTKYNAELDACKGLVFKKVKNANPKHNVHFTKSKSDVLKVIEICNAKLKENKGTEKVSKANAAETNIYQSLSTEELLVVPTK
jgi:tetratricopeptide (TPR) repeat protein